MPQQQSLDERLGSDPDVGREHRASYFSIRQRLRRHEGFTTHMYRDSDKGKVTVGIGFLIDTETKVSEFVWYNRFTRRPVNKFIAIEEWKRVKKLPYGQSYGAGWYRKFTALDIQKTKINLTLDSKLRQLHRDLRWQFRNRFDIIFDELPAPVQEALFDLGWTSGAGFLSSTKVDENGETVDAWPLLRAAILRGDWQAAADQSSRAKVSARRNLEVHDLFMRAIDEPAPRARGFGEEAE